MGDGFRPDPPGRRVFPHFDAPVARGRVGLPHGARLDVDDEAAGSGAGFVRLGSDPDGLITATEDGKVLVILSWASVLAGVVGDDGRAGGGAGARGCGDRDGGCRPGRFVGAGPDRLPLGHRFAGKQVGTWDGDGGRRYFDPTADPGRRIVLGWGGRGPGPRPNRLVRRRSPHRWAGVN